MVERAALTSGESVLDAGCGPGDDLFDMVEHVGPGGRLVGLDASEVMIAEARRRAAQRSLPITFEVGEATALPFPDATFDVCRAARLLEHLPDPRGALSEMVRVTRPGGRIVVFDFDWDTLIIDHPDKETTRTVVLTYSDSIQNGWIGRQLPRLFESNAWICSRSIPYRSSSTTRWPSCSSAPTSSHSRQTGAPPRSGTAVVGVPAIVPSRRDATRQLHGFRRRRRQALSRRRAGFLLRLHRADAAASPLLSSMRSIFFPTTPVCRSHENRGTPTAAFTGLRRCHFRNRPRSRGCTDLHTPRARMRVSTGATRRT